MDPKFDPPVVPKPRIVSIRKAIAVRIPPPITKGSMAETPAIRLVYILCPALPFAESSVCPTPLAE